MNTQIQWRCGSCGLSNQVHDTQCICGEGLRPDKSQDRSRLLSAALSNVGNENVQNNVNNVAVHGDIHLGNYFTQSPEEETEVQDELEDEDRGSRRRSAYRKREPEGFWSNFFYVTCTAAMWVSMFAIGSVVIFFGTIFVKAFFFQ